MTNAIEVSGLTKTYSGKTVVNNVTMSVAQGEIVGFLGPNGSGKTTTIRIMCGLLTPDSGSGRVLGYDLNTESLKIKNEVGYMTQKFSFYEDLSIEENLMFVARLYKLKPPASMSRRPGRPRADGAAQAIGRHAFGRLEAAPRARRLHHARSEAAAAGRADGGCRSQGAARVLG